MTTKYKKGEAFKSAVEMFEWLLVHGKVIDSEDVVFLEGYHGFNEIKIGYDKFHKLIPIEEEKITEYWLWDYKASYGRWVSTATFYSDEFKNTEGDVSEYLKNLPDNKKRKMEGSLLRLNEKGEIV